MNRRIRNPAAPMVLVAALALSAGASAGSAASVANNDRTTMAERDVGTTRMKPDYVTRLQAAYGAPSQEGFGSAVFHETMQGTDNLTQAALAKYRYFVGKLWARYGEDAWMGPWKEVYARLASAKPDIVAELRGIADQEAQRSVPMVLDNVASAEVARAALSAAFDDPALTELRAFNLGDGGAMSGLLIAGRRGSTGETTFLVFLMD